MNRKGQMLTMGEEMSGTRPKLGDVLLCVDQGRVAGWALIRVGQPKPTSSGVCKSASERCDVVTRFLDSGERVWLVLEDHSRMPLVRGTRFDHASRKSGAVGTRSTASILGQGAAAGRWKEQVELQGLPKTHVLQVAPDVWKGAVLGRRWAKAGTEAVRAESVKWATALLGQDVQHDAAAAVAMAVYCAREWAR